MSLTRSETDCTCFTDVRLCREPAARAEDESALQRLARERDQAEERARQLAAVNATLSRQHRELDLARRRLAAQYAVLHALARSTSLQEAAPGILEAIGNSMDWGAGTLWLPDARRATLHPAEVWASPTIGCQDFIPRARRVTYGVGEGMIGKVFQTGEPAWMDDASKSLRFRRAELAAAAGLHGAVWFPIRHGSAVYGVVEFFRREEEIPDEETLLAISALGGQIGQFIERVRAVAALEQSEERLTTTLRSIGDAVVATDADGRIEFMNPIAERLTGWPSEEARGLPFAQVLRFVDACTLAPEPNALARAVERGPFVELTGNTLLLARDGTGVLVDRSAGPMLGPEATALGVVLVFRDVTEARRAQVRSRFGAEASALLSTTLECEAPLASLAQMAVPAVADLCAIELVEGEQLRSAAFEHRDVARAARFRQLRGGQRIAVGRALGLGGAVLLGSPDLIATRGDSRLAISAEDQPLVLLSELGARCALIAPLVAQGRNLGVLVLAMSESGRTFDAEDLALAEELGRRIGLALDNARLFLRAQEAVRARDEFLSIASHELKTPLTSLRLQVQGLERAASRGGLRLEHAQAKLRQADRQAGRLDGLINELLDVSNLTAGRLHLTPERLDLSALVREVAGTFAGTLTRVGSTLELWSPGPIVGRWDRMRLEQVVTNLLSNAAKYGCGRPIRVRLGRSATAVTLSVADQGIGIQPEDTERIFARFERAVSARHYGGLGVGLYIVRRVLDAMGGTIALESVPGRGTTFTVSLQLEATTPRGE